MQRVRCKSSQCRADIIFAMNDRNRETPVDAEPHPQGTITLIQEGTVTRARDVPRGKLAGVRAHGTPLYRLHMKTCPDRKRWKRLATQKKAP